MTNRVVRFVVGGVVAVAAGLIGIELAGGGHSPVRATLEPVRTPSVSNGTELARPTTLGDAAIRPREADPASLPTGLTTPVPAPTPARQAAAAPAAGAGRCGDDAVVGGGEEQGTWVLSSTGRRIEIKFRNATGRLLPARGGLIEFIVDGGGPPERREVKPYTAELCPGEELMWTALLDHDPVGEGRLVEER